MTLEQTAKRVHDLWLSGIRDEAVAIVRDRPSAEQHELTRAVVEAFRESFPERKGR